MRHILSRVAFALGTLLFVITFNFFLFRAAGDPERDLLRGRKLTPAAIDKIIQERGLARQPAHAVPALSQVGRAAATSSAASTAASPSPTSCIDALPNTLILVGSPGPVATFVGSWIGDRRRLAPRLEARHGADAGVTDVLLDADFWLGMILIWIFAVKVTLFPTGLKSEPGATVRRPAATRSTSSSTRCCRS